MEISSELLRPACINKFLYVCMYTCTAVTAKSRTCILIFSLDRSTFTHFHQRHNQALVLSGTVVEI
jgi:hypothetical protein